MRVNYVDEQNRFFTAWGDDSSPRVVMIHGSVQGSPMSGADHFAAQQGLSERGWYIVAPDRAGHGKSSRSDHPDDVKQEGAWVSTLLEDGAHLVGHSLGGAIAFAACAQRPDAVRSLTLIEPALQMMAGSLPAVQEFFRAQVALFGSKKSAEEIATEFTRMAGIPEEFRKNRTQAASAGLGQALRAVRWPSLGEFNQFAEIIKKARVPVLVVSGGWKQAFDDTCRYVAEAVGGEHRIVRSPHHFPNLVSDEFNNVLHRFMSEADARRNG